MLKKSFAVVSSKKIKKFSKTIEVDSDKSISIRSFLIASISHNISEIKNVLESEDILSCINCLKKLGVKIKKVKAKHYLVYGKGLGSFYAKKNTVLDCGNSGTTARLLVGLLSTNPEIQVKIKGDNSLNMRNMRSFKRREKSLCKKHRESYYLRKTENTYVAAHTWLHIAVRT